MRDVEETNGAKQLQDLAWIMWDHRNQVKNEDPNRHFLKTELEEINAEIEREWTRGSTGLLRQDKFLFRHKESIDERSLEKKREWLQSVLGARAAAEAEAMAQDSYAQERRGLDNFLRTGNVRGQKKQRR